MKLSFFLLFLPLLTFALEIKQTPIVFSEKRIDLTKEYIHLHYGIDVKNTKITPKIIVLHYTARDDCNASLACLMDEELKKGNRPEIRKGGSLNVSAHFLVERDGTIQQLMPLDMMARHVIGLNYNSIGIENVGKDDDLTPKQVASNIALVKYLQKKFPSIEYLIGHYEYRCFEKTPLWLEKSSDYRTEKHDPSPRFMSEVRRGISGLKGAPCQ
jgi:beta-N-acetylhexosaminidase